MKWSPPSFARFRPSAQLDRPYVMLGFNVFVIFLLVLFIFIVIVAAGLGIEGTVFAMAGLGETGATTGFAVRTAGSTSTAIR